MVNSKKYKRVIDENQQNVDNSLADMHQFLFLIYVPTSLVGL